MQLNVKGFRAASGSNPVNSGKPTAFDTRLRRRYAVDKAQPGAPAAATDKVCSIPATK